MNDGIVGIGIDLTQHVPLVSVAVCPEAMRADSTVDAASLARHWPPKVELRGSFRPHLPSAVLPLIPGEPLLVGDAAAAHRRSAGLVWPPEAQVPYAGDPACGVGRIPLVAAWTALLPLPGADEGLARRDDPEFTWCPEGREHTARAGQILAASIKAFLNAACMPLNSCLTAIVVPNALDEAGQQILLDSLAQVGLATEKVHLLPRPLAVALHWCHTPSMPSVGQVTDDEEDKRIGRLRVVTMALDIWEAVSLELHTSQHEGRVWIVPVRDRTLPADAPPELQALGLDFALALAYTDVNGESLGWWPRVFASDWLEKRLVANRDLSPQELEAIRKVYSPNLSESLRQEFSQLSTLRHLWSRLFQTGPPLRDAIGQRWEGQERSTGTATLPCAAVLIDGAFTGLRMEHDSTIAYMGLPSTPGATIQVFPPNQPAAAQGAALAAAAIAHSLPCYRETLLPLDLCSIGRSARGDPVEVWQELVEAKTVEAGKEWSRSKPVEGLALPANTPKMTLTLRRQIDQRTHYRKVETSLLEPLSREEPVLILVSVRSGQGYAKVRVNSEQPGLITQLLDWRTMESCDKPPPIKWGYPPGVGIVEPEGGRGYAAEPQLRRVIDAFATGQFNMVNLLADFIEGHLRQYIFFGITGHDQVFQGLVSSDGHFGSTRQTTLFREMQRLMGERFLQCQRGSGLWDKILRASGWLYCGIPGTCLDHLRWVAEGFTSGRVPDLTQTELHAMGLSFSGAKDIKLFHKAFLMRFSKPVDSPNEWLRALRNIVQFREQALSDDCISSDSAQRMVLRITELLAEEASRRNVGQKFINCIRALPFILKRRRYDPGFLQLARDTVATRLVALLEEICSPRSGLAQRLPEIHRHKPAATLRFLKEEAIMEDTIIVARS